MLAPQQPVILSPDAIQEMDRRLSDLRHNINNHLSLIVASVELIRRKPETASRMVETIADQPNKITEELRQFSDFMERSLQIMREE